MLLRKAKGRAESYVLNDLYNQWQEKVNSSANSAQLYSQGANILSLVGFPELGIALDVTSNLYHQYNMPEDFIREMEIDMSDFKYAGIDDVMDANAASSDALTELSTSLYANTIKHAGNIFQTNDELDWNPFDDD